MTHDVTASTDINAAPAGGGYVLPLFASVVLTLVWGAYTFWVSFEILTQAPRA